MNTFYGLFFPHILAPACTDKIQRDSYDSQESEMTQSPSNLRCEYYALVSIQQSFFFNSGKDRS